MKEEDFETLEKLYHEERRKRKALEAEVKLKKPVVYFPNGTRGLSERYYNLYRYVPQRHQKKFLIELAKLADKEDHLESRIEGLKEGIATEKEDLWSIVGDPTLKKRPLWLFNKLQSIYDNLGELLTPKK